MRKPPRLVVVTDEATCRAAGRTLVETVELAVAGGASGFLFREKHLPRPERFRLAEKVAGALPAGSVLIVASDVDLARAVGAAGVHLAASEPSITTELMVGRSCHSLSEVEAAAGEGVDYVTVSPVYPSVSKPGYGSEMPAQRLKLLVSAFPGPVLALGGIGPGRLGRLMEAGVYGVAVAGAVMSAADPAAVVVDLLEEIRGGAT